MRCWYAEEGHSGKLGDQDEFVIMGYEWQRLLMGDDAFLAG